MAASHGPSVVNVAGNLSNTGDIEVAVSASDPNARIQYGTSTLNVAGTLNNQAGGLLNINDGNQQQFAYATVGALNAQNLENYGTANFQAGTTSAVAHLTNYGTLNIYATRLAISVSSR